MLKGVRKRREPRLTRRQQNLGTKGKGRRKLNILQPNCRQIKNVRAGYESHYSYVRQIIKQGK